MFDARLRLMGDDGSKGRVLPTLEWLVTQVDSGSPTITFSVSEKVAGRLDSPQVVAVEYTTGSGSYIRPRGGLFIVDQDSADDADSSGVVQFSGQDYLTWLMARTYLHWAPTAVNGERIWTESGHPASAGTIVGGMIWESQNRNWGVIGGAQRVEVDFTWDKDSNGEPWTSDEKVLQSWRLLTPLSQILRSVTEQGLADWWTEDLKLRMFRPGAGVLRENLVFGGPTFTARPTKSSFADVVTNLTVVPEKADFWQYPANPGATTRFGRLEGTLTLSGVSDPATALKLAQPVLEGSRSVKREYSFDWLPAVAGPLPWAHFNIGDTGWSKTRHGKTLQRVVGIQVGKNGTTLTARAILGDRLLSQAAKQARRTTAGAIAGGIGGSGAAFPLPEATFADPLAPTSFRVASNVGSWREDGTAQATVKLEWDAVSQTGDGSAVDIAGYEVAVRTLTSDPVVFATVESLSVTTSEWEPGKERLVKVRARDHRGQVSAWSGEISVTPDVPLSIIPKAPTGLEALTNKAVFQDDGSAMATVMFIWDEVTQSIDNTPVDVVEYELQYGPSTYRMPGTTAAVSLPSGKTGSIRVRARTSHGVWSDPSAPVSATGAAPAALTGVPTKPILTTGNGMVVYAWGGTLTTGAPSAGLNGVVAEFALNVAGPWTGVGGLMVSANGGVIKGVAGQTIWVRYRTKDTLGRTGAPSEAASILVTAVGAGDIDQAILDAITQAQSDAAAAGTAAATAQSAAGSAQTTATAAQGAASTAQSAANQAAADALAAAGIANGKGKIIHQASAPTGANANANNLWIRTSDNKPHTYDGTTWAAVTDKAATDAAAAAAAADGKAVTAKQAADAAQAKADQAFTNAAAAATAAGNAQTSADGKNRVWYQTAPPAGTGHKVNDIWFDTDNGNAIAYWTGTVWGAAPLGTAAIQDAAITNAKIANLDAAKITTGFLAAARIAANSITADKVLISEVNNLIPNGSGEAGASVGWAANLAWDSVDKPVGLPGSFAFAKGQADSPFFAAMPPAPVEPDTEYLFEIWLKADVPNSLFYLSFLDQAGSDAPPRFTTTGLAGAGVTPLPTGYTYPVTAVVVPAVWTKYQGVIKTGATVTALRPGRAWPNHPNGVEKNALVKIAGLRIQKRGGGELIVDGSVLTRHLKADEIWANTAWIDLATINVLKAGSVKVDMLEPNIGDSLNLFGNTAINMLVGRTDAADSHLTNLDGQVAGAQNTADTAKDNANAANNAAAAVSNRLNEHQLTFGVEPDMVRIGRPSGASEVRLRPDPAVELVVNGVVGASLSESVLTVPEAKLEKAVIAGLRVEGDGNGGTLFMLM